MSGVKCSGSSVSESRTEQVNTTAAAGASGSPQRKRDRQFADAVGGLSPVRSVLPRMRQLLPLGGLCIGAIKQRVRHISSTSPAFQPSSELLAQPLHQPHESEMVLLVGEMCWISRGRVATNSSVLLHAR